MTTRWYSAGREIDIDKMSNAHLLNAIPFLRRQGVVPCASPDPDEGAIFEAPIDSDAIDDMGALSALARMEADAQKPFQLHCMLEELRRRGLEEQVPLSLTREEASQLFALLGGRTSRFRRRSVGRRGVARLARVRKALAALGV